MEHPRNQDTIEAIITLNSLKWSNCKIARALSVHRKQIARILKSCKNLERPIKDSWNSGDEGDPKYPLPAYTCQNCRRRFQPRPQHVGRQKFCNKAECKAASKQYSQEKWCDKNPDYWT